jgi:hypothetical protein
LPGLGFRKELSINNLWFLGAPPTAGVAATSSHNGGSNGEGTAKRIAVTQIHRSELGLPVPDPSCNPITLAHGSNLADIRRAARQGHILYCWRSA